MSSVAADEISTVTGAGACVGRPVSGMAVKIIEPVDGPIGALDKVRELPPGGIGEIIVAGPVVTKIYDDLPVATTAAKIPDEAR